jgi:hypothetical protein
VGKWHGRMNIVHNCVHRYVNGRIISVETVPGMGGEGMRENGGEGDFKYDIFDIL